MTNISNIEIWGTKKFEHIKVLFNSQINIIVGENGSGKSTILETINIALHQWYKNYDRSIVKDLLNVNQVLIFMLVILIEEMLPFKAVLKKLKNIIR